MKTRQLAAMAIIICSTTTTSLAEPATIVSDAKLHQRPTYLSPMIKQIKAGTQVELISRSGGWKKISTLEDVNGWVRSYQVRNGIIITERKKESGGFFSSLASLSRKASGLFSSDKKDFSFQRTATIGVRGLSEEQIKNAQPDLHELKKMESYRSKKSKAKKFAKKGKLVKAKIEHMPKSKVEK